MAVHAGAHSGVLSAADRVGVLSEVREARRDLEGAGAVACGPCGAEQGDLGDGLHEGSGGERSADAGGNAYKVEQFKEKPTRPVAESWLATGQYSWNAGMFVWRCDAMLAELQRQKPELHDGLMRIAAA